MGDSTKSQITEKHYKNIIDLIGGIDTEDDEEHTNGKQIYEAFVNALRISAGRNNYSSERMSALKGATIAKFILRVESSETFLDFAAGIGISTNIITNGTRPVVEKEYPAIINVDIDPIACSINAMCLILYGYKKDRFDVRCEDSIIKKIRGLSADKIFTDLELAREDLPENLKMKYRELPIDRALDYLSENGLAVIPVQRSYLSSSTTSLIEHKSKLVNKKYLKAVIQFGDEFLIVLEKKNSNRNFVRFIETNVFPVGHGISFFGLYEGKNPDPKEAIDIPIKDIGIQNGNGGYDEYNLLPSLYLEHPTKEPIDMKKVSKELKEGYERLAEIKEPIYSVPDIDKELKLLYEKL